MNARVLLLILENCWIFLKVIYSQKELNPSVRGMSPYVRQGNTVLVNDYFLGGHIIIKKTTK